MCLAVIVGVKEEAVMKKERARNGSKLDQGTEAGTVFKVRELAKECEDDIEPDTGIIEIELSDGKNVSTKWQCKNILENNTKFHPHAKSL